jgi:hypothetical protein
LRGWPTNSNSYPPGHPPEALTEIEPSLLPATLILVFYKSNAAVGPVMVKFLSTEGVLLSFAVILYVPAAKLQ